MPGLAVIAILALASFRITRLFAADTITIGLRDWLYHRAYDDSTDAMIAHAAEQRLAELTAVPRAAWRTWAYALYTCQWCLGVWVSIVVYCAWRWGGDVALAVLAVAAVAGAQGALAAVVGGGEDE